MSTNGTGKKITTLKRMTVDPYLTPHIEINSVNQRPKCETSNYKTLRRKCWEENHDMKFGKDFLNMTPKVEVIK